MIGFLLRGRTAGVVTAMTLMTFTSVHAQTGVIAGTVKDDGGSPIALAEVGIPALRRSVATTATGAYEITGVPEGSQVITVRLIGYRPVTDTVAVTNGQRVTHDVTMRRDPLNLSAIVVTGTETPRSRLETSNATTVLSPSDLTQVAPRSTTEALRYVPGFTRIESSGGEVNENISMRGILGVEYVMFMEDGLPVFPTMHTLFMNADNLFRMDENVARMEVVRGAGSALFGSNTPGAIINIINKTGGSTLQGDMKAWGGTGGLARYDFNANGPIGSDWNFNAGGFYRYDRGVRNPGFPGTDGGQFKASLTRNFDNGFFRTSLKVINDRNQFILDLPYMYPDSTDLTKFQRVPGFSATGSMNTNEGNGISVPTPDGQLTLPLENGLLTHAYWLTADAGFNLANGWNVENAAQLMANHQEWNAIVPFDVMDTSAAVGQYITQYWGSYYQGILQGRGTIPGNATNLSITVQPGYKYHMTYPNALSPGGTPLAYSDANGLLSPGGEWHVNKPISAFQDQLTLKKDLPGGNNVSFGVYFANYNQGNNWYFTDILTNVADNPHFVDLNLDTARVVFHYNVGATADSVVVPLGHFAATKNGFRRFVSNYVNGTGQTTVFSGVAGGSFHLSDRLRADLGVRYESDAYVQTSQNTTVTPVAGDTAGSLNVVNQDVWGANSSYRHFGRTLDDWAASIGLNYEVNPQTTLYALGSRAYKMPALDEFLNASAEQQVDLFKSKRNETVEVGVKHLATNFGVTLDGYYTILKDIVSQGLVTDPGTGLPIWIIQANPEVSSYGLELEASGQLPHSGLSAMTNWTLLKAVYASCPPGSGGCPTGADIGTLLAGVPPIVGNLTAMYAVTPQLHVDGDWHFVDRRCTNVNNCDNQLPTYSYFNFGAEYIIPSSGLSIRGDLLNAFNSEGLEEGNPRLSLLPNGRTSNLFLARPILPRMFQVSMGYRF